MCTIAAKYVGDQWWLLKTRDPVSFMRWDDTISYYAEPEVDKIAKYLIENPIHHEDGYYGGINANGVAVVATYVPVSPLGISYLRKPYLRIVLDAPTTREAVEIIKGFSPRIGGNILVADKQDCYLIEAAPQEYSIRQLENEEGSYCVRTNHFLNLSYPNLVHERDSKERAWSEAHYNRAKELVVDANSLVEFKALLRDRKGHELGQAICTTSEEDQCYTHSAMIFATAEKTAHYSQGNPLEADFKKIQFPKQKS